MYITNDWEFSTEWGPVVWKIGGAKFHQSMSKGSTKINTSLSFNLSKYFIHQSKRHNKQIKQTYLKIWPRKGELQTYPPTPSHPSWILLGSISKMIDNYPHSQES